ncbi:hypothetical protein pqer_cds_99 [Pandoravirus quercus]|uniref:Protein kinase domain-containing protein n=1 Tax=Pandoravirus quercus TaxID=2107709 RepID=A0A2U7U7W8_9VIRU|nr:hypothetical protein pqer_cds_99 [Pandoravirus quercus]AVK74521.1 hypothetical protein pqer_cds_99 [Pandoravirus quercus]
MMQSAGTTATSSKLSSLLAGTQAPSACGLRPLPRGETGEAGTASAAAALSLVEAAIEERARVAGAMGRALAGLVYELPTVPGAMPATDPMRLDTGLYLVRALGSGAYGSVCAAGFRRPPPDLAAATSTGSGNRRATEDTSSPPQLPLAIKVTTVAPNDSPDVAVREVVLTGMLSALVKTRACPNLPCAYGAAARYPPPVSTLGGRTYRVGGGAVDLFQEVADCDLAAWAAGVRRSEAEWMSVAFQVCAGLSWAARVYDLANNDLYGRNILLSRILASPGTDTAAMSAGGAYEPPCARGDLTCDAEPVFRYALQSRAHGWRRFAVRTRCWLARATDFALASSDRLRALGIDVAGHDDVAGMYGAAPGGQGAAAAPVAPSVESLASLVGADQAPRHAIFHPYLNAYARDLAVLLATVAYEDRAPASVRRWGLLGLHALYAEIASKEPARRLSGPFRAALATAGRRRGATGASAAVTSLLATTARNRAFRQPDDLIDFIAGTLFEEGLLREAGLSENLFVDDVGAIAAAGTQFFALPILDTPPPVEAPTVGAPVPQPVGILARAFDVPF